jgi:uncharacterized cupredoxin-like copper-binding protein
VTRRRSTAALVALTLALAACSGSVVAEPAEGGHGTSGEHAAEGDTPPVDGARRIAITAVALAFEPTTVELAVGEPVNLALTSEDTLHDLNVDEVGFHVVAGRGSTSVGGIEFTEPGTYVAYCSVPGHREAGMELELTVGP